MRAQDTIRDIRVHRKAPLPCQHKQLIVWFECTHPLHLPLLLDRHPWVHNVVPATVGWIHSAGSATLPTLRVRLQAESYLFKLEMPRSRWWLENPGDMAQITVVLSQKPSTENEIIRHVCKLILSVGVGWRGKQSASRRCVRLGNLLGILFILHLETCG